VINVTVFKGDKNSPFDEESQITWLGVGVPKTRIFPLDKKQNWWDAGEVGPGGPDSEIFIDTGKNPCNPNCNPACNCGKYIEIWNNVFIVFNRKSNGSYEPLRQKNVDTGMGVARTTAVLQGHFDDYKTELFAPIISEIETLANKKYGTEATRPIRIIADHIRAAVFIATEGVTPSKTEQGYVLRRLIRRAIREGKNLGIEENFTSQLAKVVFDIYTPLFPELKENQNNVVKTIEEEEKTFRKTLVAGLKQFEKLSCKVCAKTISGQQAFDLYQSFGFPLELTEEMAQEKGFSLDKAGFEKEFGKHQEKSRTAAKGHFKGGLAQQCEETTKLHTATHLLNRTLKVVLGAGIHQRGSNITPARLRFDFNFERKLSEQEIKEIESQVNKQITANLPVEGDSMALQDALNYGAEAQFAQKYGEVVKVFTVGNPKNPYSAEICGGPHVSSTGTLGRFRIIKQESVGKGVRRIKATLEKN
ncbi:MAG: alanine--tRNA ligase, partial [bacterium]